ncbi:MAG: hypothetical protein JW742_04345 [Candidatus Aminicenantes bacterium]|nr:hypothetical protein [Candidatus Aminicenantes bacterium]
MPFAFVESRLNRMPKGWPNAVGTYARLRPGASREGVAEKITALIKPHLDPKANVPYTIEPLTRIRLDSSLYRWYNEWGQVKEPRGKIKDFALEGDLGLQNHDSESPVYFRRIYVKEL